MVDGNKLNSVLEFTYLGSTISNDGCIDDEIQRRMTKASASFGRLRQRLWNNHHVSMGVKGKIYRAIVLSTLLYGAEVWTVYIRQVKKLHAFMMRHLRSIMRITWMDRVTNNEILERTGRPYMGYLLIRKNLRRTGHLIRMSPDRLQKQIIYSQLSSGHRKKGRPRLLFKDTTNRTLQEPESIMVDGNKLNSVLEFTYLGTTISSNGCFDDEIHRRVAKARASFGQHARDSGTTTMWPCGLKARYTVLSCCPPSYT